MKGASVLRQLLAYVGESDFQNALSGYFRRHEYGNTTLTDFLDALTKGGRDLTAWSAEWLETAGPNTLQAEYTVDDAGAFSSFAVAQTASANHPTLRTHRLAIGLYSSVAGPARARTPGGDGHFRCPHGSPVAGGPRTPGPGTGQRRRPDLREDPPGPHSWPRCWALATDDGDRSAQVRMAYVAGFWHHAQVELLAPYITRYFTELDDIWTRHDGGLNAVHLSYRLFPDIVTQSTVDAADRWLSGDKPPAQHRLVLERYDEITRALNNRSRDS